MTLIDKTHLVEMILKKLEANLQVLIHAAFQAKEDSTNEESKAENKYDTRGLEASYLAAGQAKRAQELQEQIYLLRQVKVTTYNENQSIGISALVEFTVNNLIKHVILLPIGGVEVEYKNLKIQTLTLDAPLGKKLLGQMVGADFEMNSRIYEVISVQ
jgi:transcription elongation GreA/GreB family factor